jgi:hypothetical protein
MLLLASAAFAQEAPKDAAPPAAPPPKAAETPPVPGHAAFTGTLDELAAKHPHVKLAEIGKSRGGRALRTATVLCDGTKSDDDVVWVALVVAGLDGHGGRGDEWVARDLVAEIAARAATLPARTAIRVLADANPDASAALRPSNDCSTDDDQDGTRDEDAPDDLDGDGRIGWMRIPDAAGDFAADDAAKPGSAPVRADAAKGKPPVWKIVREGKDDDGDGLFNEDGPGGVDLSRNFAIGFEEHVPACGAWAASEPETRALMDHLLADERIAVVYEIGGAETCAANAEGPWTKLPDDDMKLLDGLRSSHAKGAAEHKPRAPGHGSLGATAVHQLGRIWFGRAPLGRTGAPWPANDSVWPTGVSFRWKAAPAGKGPAGAEIATIELVADTKPAPLPTDETPEIADFLAALAAGRAQVAFDEMKTSGEPGVVRISARLVNKGRLPTHTQRGAEVRGRRPLNVRVKLPPGATLLGGDPLVQIERIAGGARSNELRWVVAGRSGEKVTLEVTAPDGGTTTSEVVIP